MIMIYSILIPILVLNYVVLIYYVLLSLLAGIFYYYYPSILYLVEYSFQITHIYIVFRVIFLSVSSSLLYLSLPLPISLFFSLCSSFSLSLCLLFPLFLSVKLHLLTAVHSQFSTVFQQSIRK